MCPNIHPNSFHGEWFNSPNHSHNQLTSFPYKQIIFGSYNLEARRDDNLTSRKSEINSPFFHQCRKHFVTLKSHKLITTDQKRRPVKVGLNSSIKSLTFKSPVKWLKGSITIDEFVLKMMKLHCLKNGLQIE
jgi:hypothetical protein